MSSIIQKLKFRQDVENTDKTTFMMRNGESVLKELIRASNGKYNPYRIFSAKELKIATNNYDSEKVIKGGETYKLYKGFWQERSISVMKFDTPKAKAHRRCINNIAFASQMCPKYILQLIGCCLETEIPVLIFEYAENGTLADRIFGSVQPHFEPLLISHRLKIAMDIAHAVAYLHLGFPRPIIFRDFKISSILINEQNVAKLFDFSLSISIPEGETQVIDAEKGTIGFIVPEYLRTGELLTEQRSIDFDRLEEDNDVILIDHMKKYYEENKFIEVVDPLIVEDKSCIGKEHQLQAFTQLIFECVNESPVDKSTMVDIAKRLRQMHRSCSCM